MRMDCIDCLETREIRLRGPHPGLTGEVALMLAELPGVQWAEAPSPHALRVGYDLRRIGLRDILRIMESWGLHLDESLWSRLSHALAFYTEDAQRETLHLPISRPEAMRELASHVHARHRAGGAHDGNAWDRYL